MYSVGIWYFKMLDCKTFFSSVNREEIRKKQGGEFSSPQPIAGGVRILPPSPVTVRKTQEHHYQEHKTQQRVHFEQDSEAKEQLLKRQGYIC